MTDKNENVESDCYTCKRLKDGYYCDYFGGDITHIIMIGCGGYDEK